MSVQRPKKAISLWQPWAWLIVNAYKGVENRAWDTGYRGPLYIHASKTLDPDFLGAMRFIYERVPDDVKGLVTDRSWWDSLPRGAIVGEAVLSGTVYASDDPWFVGPFGLMLTQPVAYDEPIPFPGRQKLFNVELSEVT